MDKVSVTKRVLLYIEENLEQDLTLEKIAKEFSYSKFYLARRFKEDMRCTLYQYIRERRLEEAAKKLVCTRESIVEIAYEAGYGSQQAFTLAFHNEYLCAPQEYRKAGVFMPRQNRADFRSGISNAISNGIVLSGSVKGGIAA